MLSIRRKEGRWPGAGVLLLGAVLPLTGQSALVDFGSFALAGESYFQVDPPPGGDGGSATLEASGVELPHTTPSWGGFSAFTVSNRTDATTPGFGNAGSAITGGGFGDANYAVGYINGESLSLRFTQAGGVVPETMRVTNTTYAALSMRDGDAFAKKFGGADGGDPDYFRLSIEGLDATAAVTGTVEFYLADYRFAEDGRDYIVESWEEVDLSALGSGVTELRFSLDSSDVGQFGMNTPSYFAMDELSFTAVPEPSVIAVLAGIAALGVVARRRLRGRCG